VEFGWRRWSGCGLTWRCDGSNPVNLKARSGALTGITLSIISAEMKRGVEDSVLNGPDLVVGSVVIWPLVALAI
jgi:hypothetical protein